MDITASVIFLLKARKVAGLNLFGPAFDGRSTLSTERGMSIFSWKVGGDKTRFFIKPNLLQCDSEKYPVSFVVSDPKSELLRSTGMMLKKKGYELKYFNTLDFKNSMHYNPFEYIHSEKDILKLVTALMANTKGEGKAGDPFWEKSELLLYTALIGYIHYVCPMEEQNFMTLLDMLNSMDVREDDEDYLNPVDIQFEALKRKEPDNFAVRQYTKFKQAATRTRKTMRSVQVRLSADLPLPNLNANIGTSLTRRALRIRASAGSAQEWEQNAATAEAGAL